MSILIENVTKHFGQNIVLDGINLEIKTGSLVALLGGSGSGKSTLLRVVAGFEEPTTGRVWLNGKDSNILSIQEKEIGFVFQAYALFQHLTVYENIAFGLSCNSSFFELGLSKNPLVSYFSQSRSFLLALLSFCKHTIQKYIKDNKHKTLSPSKSQLVPDIAEKAPDKDKAPAQNRALLEPQTLALANLAKQQTLVASFKGSSKSLEARRARLHLDTKSLGLAPNTNIASKEQPSLFSVKEPFLKKLINKSTNLDTEFDNNLKLSINSSSFFEKKEDENSQKFTAISNQGSKKLSFKEDQITSSSDLENSMTNTFRPHQLNSFEKKQISASKLSHRSTGRAELVHYSNSFSNGNLRSVEELLRLVGLEELAHRYPNQLSGGQCQRVALARALAVQPKVLLLDEPFGALDTKVRKNLRRWLRQLHERVGVTTLFVTHDHQEAMEVANEIVVLEKGRVKHSLNSPQKIFSRLTKVSSI